MDNKKALFIQSIVIGRDSKGDWCITKVLTNYGKFAVGEIENKAVDINLIANFSGHVCHELKPTLEAFVQEEEAERANKEGSNGSDSVTTGSVK